MTQPLVTFCVNSYNRLPLLRNLLRSFEACNVYPKVEWVAVDYGSTDGSREFLREFEKSAPFPVKLVIEDANHYPTIFGRFRNDARQVADGQFFVEVPEDQQFISRRDWVSECMQVFDHRRLVSGQNDLSCIVAYGYPRWRLDKSNNALHPQEHVDGVPYFIAKQKAYVDYHIMPRETYERVGPYLEPPEFDRRSPLWGKWLALDPEVRPEQDYERRCAALGLRRAFLKYPALVSFPNGYRTVLNLESDGLAAPLWSRDELERRFSELDRPVSSDDLAPEQCASREHKSTWRLGRIRAALGHAARRIRQRARTVETDISADA